MTKILVTGGAGFIGSNLVDKLIDEGYDVSVIDNLSGGKKENLNSAAKFFQYDICDYDKILPLFENIEYVFHLAALPRVQHSIENPIETHNANVNGTLNILTIAKEKNIKKLIFSSSSAIYGDVKTLPTTEQEKPNPMSPYALHKLISEQYCELFNNLYGIKVIALRYFNVYGNRQSGEGAYATVIAKFFEQKKVGKPMTIFGDGEQTRDYVNISDVVNANILAMKSDKVGKGEKINICGGKNYSVNQIANFVGGERTHLEAKKGEPRNTLGDYSLAKELLGWTPKIELEEGIKTMLK